MCSEKLVSNLSMSGEKIRTGIDMEEHINKWREERQKRLLNRIYGRNRLHTFPGMQPSISAAVLGIKKITDGTANIPADVRLSLKPEVSRRSTFNKNVEKITKSKQLQCRFSHGNIDQKRSTISQCDFVPRRSIMKISTTDKFAQNKLIKNEKVLRGVSKRFTKTGMEIKTCTKAGETNNTDCETKKCEITRCSLASVDNKILTENKVPEDDADDKHNSTFTLKNDDDNDENLPSPIKKPSKTDDNKPKQNNELQSILRQPKMSSQADNLSKKLNEWASSRGKSVDSYRHLNCFISHIAPKTTCKTPLSTARKVQFKLSGGKTIFIPKNTVCNERRNKPLVEKNARNEKPATIIDSEKPAIIAETIQEIDESGVVESGPVICSGPTASTPEEQPLQSSLVPKPSSTKENLRSMTVSALEELLSLIQANYSIEACEEWLIAIRQRNLDADELPEYWECMAAIEEARGNMFMALDSYEQAVMQGAEVNRIELCLDRMYDKLKALNISTTDEKENVTSGQSKKAVYNSAKKDIFRSTIIAFARIQKKVRQFKTEAGEDGSTVKYIVTPVRRSTRYSVSRVDSSKTISNTVKQLLTEDDENRETPAVEFKTNKALLDHL